MAMTIVSMIKEVNGLNNCEWKNHPAVIFTGLLILYTAGNSLIALLHL